MDGEEKKIQHLGLRQKLLIACTCKSKDLSLEMQARINHTLAVLLPTYGCESWTVKKADEEKQMMVLEESPSTSKANEWS